MTKSSEEYRHALAHELTSESDHEARRAKLEAAKTTPEYQASEEERRLEKELDPVTENMNVNCAGRSRIILV